MTPTEIDALAKMLREKTGSIRVEIRLTMEDGQSVIHVARGIKNEAR